MKFFTYKSAVCLQNKFDRGFVIIDGTEMLCTSKRLSSIARHSISLSSFFLVSCLFTYKPKCKQKTDRNFEMDIFGTKTTKNQLLRVKLLPEIIF